MKGSVVSEAATAILAQIADGVLKPGDRLRSQKLADQLGVSRFPIGQAMRMLAERGVVVADPGRGFTVASDAPRLAGNLDKSQRDHLLSAVYFQVAEDRLNGTLPDRVSEQAMRDRYNLSRGQLTQLLNRIAAEGWAERRPGYGWSFSAVLTTPAALEQSYRLRMAIEPASLLEPDYALHPDVLKQCWETEERMLDGEIETLDADLLYERGIRFHEAIVGASQNSFFLDALKRVNRIRRLLVYRSLADRSRYWTQAAEHLEILKLIESGDLGFASEKLRAHLEGVMKNISNVRPLLEAGTRPGQESRTA
ncbi:GntR family transcriptional regulator [Aquabacter sp. CN5-332]